MTRRRRSGPLLPILLLAVSGGLVWLIYEGAGNPPEPDFPDPVAADTVPAVATDEQTIERRDSLPPLEDFNEIVERPLFSPTRRPPPEGEVVIVEEPLSDLSADLVGVIISSEEKIAIISPKDRKDMVRLLLGDDYQGWTLVAVEPDRVTFRRGQVEEQIELSYDQAPPRRAQQPKRERQRQRQNQNNQGKSE